jgi:hypothetical protein
VRTADQLGAVADEIERRLAEIGRKVNLIVNYDNFVLAPDLSDSFAAAVRTMSHYSEHVTRYTTSAFLRLKLADQLADRGLAPTSTRAAPKRWPITATRPAERRRHDRPHNSGPGRGTGHVAPHRLLPHA